MNTRIKTLLAILITIIIVLLFVVPALGAIDAGTNACHLALGCDPNGERTWVPDTSNRQGMDWIVFQYVQVVFVNSNGETISTTIDRANLCDGHAQISDGVRGISVDLNSNETITTNASGIEYSLYTYWGDKDSMLTKWDMSCEPISMTHITPTPEGTAATATPSATPVTPVATQVEETEMPVVETPVPTPGSNPVDEPVVTAEPTAVEPTPTATPDIILIEPPTPIERHRLFMPLIIK